MLKIEHATKTFLPGTPNEHLALRDVNLHLKPGEFVTLIGTNGAGKSTLMNAISGDFLLDEGRIILDGQDITYLREYKRAAMVGRLFQDPMKGTAPGMTVEENLALAYSRRHRHSLQLALRRQDSELFRQRLAEFGLGLENRMKTKMGLLSGGQRQAVTLLMSTISTPKLLLLDEHTAALDPATAEKVLQITRQIVQRDHLTAMMITHNIHSALQMGTRTIMLDDGQIILDIQGKEREEMTVERLLQMYSQTREKELDSDRMLFSK
jgi:putative ABC transport system ATP-binding protein